MKEHTHILGLWKSKYEKTTQTQNIKEIHNNQV